MSLANLEVPNHHCHMEGHKFAHAFQSNQAFTFFHLLPPSSRCHGLSSVKSPGTTSSALVFHIYQQALRPFVVCTQPLEEYDRQLLDTLPAVPPCPQAIVEVDDSSIYPALHSAWAPIIAALLPSGVATSWDGKAHWGLRIMHNGVVSGSYFVIQPFGKCYPLIWYNELLTEAWANG